MNHATFFIIFFICSPSYGSDDLSLLKEDTFLQFNLIQKKKRKQICQKRCLTLFALGWTYAINLFLGGSTLFLSVVPCKDSSARPATTTNTTLEEEFDHAKAIKTVILPILYVVYTGSVAAATLFTQHACKKWKKDSELLKKYPHETSRLINA